MVAILSFRYFSRIFAKKLFIMAVYIKPIPVLTGKVAEKFEEAARKSEANRATVDFSREVAMAKRILEKSNIRKFKS